MATWPAKINYATGDVLTAAQMNDIGGELNDVYATSGSSAGKNKIINGNFDVWQRGTSFTASGYTADRWYASISGTTTVAQETTIIPDGSTYAIKWTTGASTSYAELYNAFEALDVNSLAGKTVTVSVKVRAMASFASTFRLRLQTNTTANTQTGGAWTTVVTTDVTPSTSAFTTATATYTIPVGTKGLRVALQPAAAQASGTGLYFGQAQLEVGSIATPFQTATGTIQGELAACQRYYWRWTTGGTSTAWINNVFNYSSTVALGTVKLPVTMRVNPTSIDVTATAADYRVLTGSTVTTCSAVPVLDTSNLESPVIKYTVASGLTVGQGGIAGANSTNNAYIGFNAEL